MLNEGTILIYTVSMGRVHILGADGITALNDLCTVVANHASYRDHKRFIQQVRSRHLRALNAKH
ncbi:hypothetical protein D3C76_431810 [compost metagenome]